MTGDSILLAGGGGRGPRGGRAGARQLITAKRGPISGIAAKIPPVDKPVVHCGGSPL